MDAGGDRYNQHVEVRFEGPRRAAPTAERRSRPHWLRRGFSALPSFLASLRKVMFDLTAIALPIGVGIFFVSILTDETIVIEVPAVPQAVQDRGITPELLTQMLQARVQEIHAAARSRGFLDTEDLVPGLPNEAAGKTLQDVIDSINRSHDVPILSDPVSGPYDPKSIPTDRIIAQLTPDTGEESDADRMFAATQDMIAATQDSIVFVLEPFTNPPEITKTAAIASPAQDPLVIETAGLHLSIDSLAHGARQLFGLGARRRLTVSVVCKTADCGDDALAFHVYASADRVVAAGPANLDIGQLGQAIDAAALHLLDSFDPQVLASHHFRVGNREEARILAERMIDGGHEQQAWAYNLLGLIEMQAKRWDLAQEPLNKALNIDEEYVPALVNLGIVKLRKGEFEQAKASYEHALKADPGNAVAYTNLGNLLVRLCEWEAAAQAYEQALETDPPSPSARISLDLMKKIPVINAAISNGPGVSDETDTRSNSAMKIGGHSKPEKKSLMLDEIFESAKKTVRSEEFCAGLAWKPL